MDEDLVGQAPLLGELGNLGRSEVEHRGVRDVARQRQFPVAGDAAGDQEPVALTAVLPVLADERRDLLGDKVPRAAVDHLIQAIEQHQRPTAGERRLKQRLQARQAAPPLIVKGEEIMQPGLELLAPQVVVVGR